MLLFVWWESWQTILGTGLEIVQMNNRWYLKKPEFWIYRNIYMMTLCAYICFYHTEHLVNCCRKRRLSCSSAPPSHCQPKMKHPFQSSSLFDEEFCGVLLLSVVVYSLLPIRLNCFLYKIFIKAAKSLRCWTSLLLMRHCVCL